MRYDALTFLNGLFAPAGPAADGPDGEIRVEDLAGDWRVWFEERAAIMEYDGKLPRERAEALALAETVRQMKRAEKESTLTT